MTARVLLLLAVCASCAGAQTWGEPDSVWSVGGDSLVYVIHVGYKAQQPDSVYYSTGLVDTTESFPLVSFRVPFFVVRNEPEPPWWQRLGYWPAVALSLVIVVALLFTARRQVEDTDEYDPDDDEQVIG